MDYDDGRKGLDVYVWNGARTRYDLYSATNLLAANTWYCAELQLSEVTAGHAEVWDQIRSLHAAETDLETARDAKAHDEAEARLDAVIERTTSPVAGLTCAAPSVRDRVLRLHACYRLARLALDVEATRRKTGAYPDKLDDSMLPTDPLGAPGRLHYERTADGFRAWSVGPDCKDAGGVFDVGDGRAIAVHRYILAEVGLHRPAVRIGWIVSEPVAAADQHRAGDTGSAGGLQVLVEDISRHMCRAGGMPAPRQTLAKSRAAA